MKFLNNLVRQQDPIASMIPESIWDIVSFHDGKELADNYLELMRLQDKGSIFAKLKQMFETDPLVVRSELSQRKRKKAWLIVAVSHLSCDKQFLRELSGLLQLSKGSFLYCLASLGRMDYFYEIASNPNAINKLYIGEVYARAAACGHLDILKFLEKDGPVVDFLPLAKGFHGASINGHLSVMHYLLERIKKEFPDKLDSVFTVSELTILFAAENGHLESVKILVSNFLKTNQLALLQNVLRRDDCYVFRKAVEKCHLEVVQYLVSLSSNWLLQEMLKSESYRVFHLAAENCDLAMLKYLFSLIKISYPISYADELIKIVSWNTANFLNNPAENDQVELCHYLLSFPIIFAYAQSRKPQYDKYVHAVAVQKLMDLRARMQTLAITDPTVLSLTERDEINLLYYILLHFIARNDPTFHEDIQFLLNLPVVVKQLSESQKNEATVKLALRYGNELAFKALVNIPEVNQIAAANNYYLNSFNMENLLPILKLVLPQVAILNFTNINIGQIGTFQQFSAVLKVIPDKIKCIHFEYTKLNALNLPLPADMNEADSPAYLSRLLAEQQLVLRQVKTIYLSKDEFDNMSDLHKLLLNLVFPNLEHPLFVINYRGDLLGAERVRGSSLQPSLYYAKSHGLKVAIVPSLQALTVFAAKNSQAINQDKLNELLNELPNPRLLSF